MTKEEDENKRIAVWWWNGGKKNLDFKGTYKEFLIQRDIIPTMITYQDTTIGYHFRIPVSSTIATLETRSYNYAMCCDEAIQVFLLLLGDKATFETERHRYHINWS